MLLIVIATLMSSPVVCPQEHTVSLSQEKDIRIVIKDPKPGKPIHRVPGIVPIQVSLIEDASVLGICFAYYIGDVKVSVSNDSFGDFFYEDIDSGLESVLIPLSHQNGFYTITFTLSDGTVYEGQFEL